MNSLKFLQKIIKIALPIVLLAGCGAPPVTPTLNPPPPTQGLVSDFTPCSGPPSGQTTTPGAGLALIAYSTNGLDFHRPANPKDGILVNRAGVTDAVLLPGGRILVYFVDGCRPYDGTQPERSAVAVTVSDQQGAPGSWVYKNVRFVNVPTNQGFGFSIVDPNVVLMPDGSLRMFATMFRPGNGSTANGAYSFTSTDGGFTFVFEGLRYDDILDPENYRFSDTNWQIITGGPKGHALSTDGGNTFHGSVMGNYAGDSTGPHTQSFSVWCPTGTGLINAYTMGITVVAYRNNSKTAPGPASTSRRPLRRECSSLESIKRAACSSSGWSRTRTGRRGFPCSSPRPTRQRTSDSNESGKEPTHGFGHRNHRRAKGRVFCLWAVASASLAERRTCPYRYATT